MPLRSRPNYSSAAREKRRVYNTKYAEKKRQDALQAYGGVCECCGETEIGFLCIDHINGGGNQHRREIGTQNIYPWLRRNHYPPGFRVLCHSCNLGRAFNGGVCPHTHPKGFLSMQVTEIPWVLNPDDYNEAAGERSPTLHLSTIIAELDHARGNTYGETDDATRNVYFSMGFIWETLVANVFPDVAIRRSAGTLFRPGELRLDGVTMSPDAVDIEDFAIEEYKATWLSSNNEIDGPKFWRWLVQMKCYCKAVGTRTARLRVMFVVGNWRGSGPQVKAWQFTFEQREIDETWQMCINHARAQHWL